MLHIHRPLTQGHAVGKVYTLSRKAKQGQNIGLKKRKLVIFTNNKNCKIVKSSPKNSFFHGHTRKEPYLAVSLAVLQRFGKNLL